MTDERILQVNHLSKSFGKHEVLRDIDFTVYQPPGDPHQRGDPLP